MKKRISILIISVFVVISCSIFANGESFFYAEKFYKYENKTGKIDIVTINNNQFENLNINFKNEGNCDVFLRAYVFIYKEAKETSILDSSSILINYNNTNWYKGANNYYYYTKALKGGEETEESLTKSINFNLVNDNLKADVVVEAVQVRNLAYKYEWEVDDPIIDGYFSKYMDN